MATSRPQVLSDCYDLPVTTSAHEALAWFNRGIHGLLGFRKDTPDCFHKALAHDATFNMAHCYLGVHYLLEESEDMVAKARTCFERAREHTTTLTDRERDVIETQQFSFFLIRRPERRILMRQIIEIVTCSQQNLIACRHV